MVDISFNNTNNNRNKSFLKLLFLVETLLVIIAENSETYYTNLLSLFSWNLSVYLYTNSGFKKYKQVV